MPKQLWSSTLQIAPPSVPALRAGATLILWALYTFVFIETAGDAIGSAAIDAAANVLPLAMLAAAVHAAPFRYLVTC